MRKKILIVVMDGLGDVGCPELHGRTPLEFTDTPNLDWFAEHGVSGIVDTVDSGIKPSSDVAHFSILGYDFSEVSFGRGPIEAAGIGFHGKEGDIAFRCNFSTVDDEMNIIDVRAGRIGSPDTTELVKSISGTIIDGVEIIVKEGIEHRAVLILRGKGLSADVTDVDIRGSGSVGLCKGLSEASEFTASIVNKFVSLSYKTMNNHPVNRRRREVGLPEANILLPRSAGSFKEITPFADKYHIRGACVAAISVIKGVCGICGMDIIELPKQCTGGIESDFILKATVALDTLEDYDFVLMNVKAPDVCSHNGSVEGKCEVIGRLDMMAKYIRDNLPKNAVVAFTADHCTPCSIRDHTSDPVPMTVFTSDIKSDGVVHFNEIDCATGVLGHLKGHDVIRVLMDIADSIF